MSDIIYNESKLSPILCGSSKHYKDMYLTYVHDFLVSGENDATIKRLWLELIKLISHSQESGVGIKRTYFIARLGELAEIYNNNGDIVTFFYWKGKFGIMDEYQSGQTLFSIDNIQHLTLVAVLRSLDIINVESISVKIDFLGDGDSYQYDVIATDGILRNVKLDGIPLAFSGMFPDFSDDGASAYLTKDEQGEYDGILIDGLLELSAIKGIEVFVKITDKPTTSIYITEVTGDVVNILAAYAVTRFNYEIPENTASTPEEIDELLTVTGDEKIDIMTTLFNETIKGKQPEDISMDTLVAMKKFVFVYTATEYTEADIYKMSVMVRAVDKIILDKCQQ